MSRPPPIASDRPYDEPPLRWSDVGQMVLFTLALPVIVALPIVIAIVEPIDMQIGLWRSYWR